jgi:hypothetical protein
MTAIPTGAPSVTIARVFAIATVVVFIAPPAPASHFASNDPGKATA